MTTAAPSFADDIASAETPSALTDVIRALWVAYQAGRLTAAEVRGLEDEALAKRDAMPGERAGGFEAVAKATPKVRRWRLTSPQRAAAVARRRRQASSSGLPPRLAEHFTEGERAALAVVGREAHRSKTCTWPMGKIAAVAGVSKDTVRRALKLASMIGMAHVQHRRVSACRNLPNLVTITAKAWWAWLRRGGGGSQECDGPINQLVRVSAEGSRGKVDGSGLAQDAAGAPEVILRGPPATRSSPLSDPRGSEAKT